MIIDDTEALCEWLAQNNWFEDGFVSSIVFESNEELYIKLGFLIEGTYRAGEPERLKEYLIHPVGVTKWTYGKDHPFQPSYNWCIDGVELSEEGYGLKFETPYIFEFICKAIQVVEERIVDRYTKPWVSSSEFFVQAVHASIPTPDYWIDTLTAQGFDVGFRFYGSELKSISEVPDSDYSGYYLQLKERINQSTEGIFFRSVYIDKNTLHISVQLIDDSLKDLYDALLGVIAKWENVVINCGNVTFTGDEWLRFKNKGVYPEKIEKMKNVW